MLAFEGRDYHFPLEERELFYQEIRKRLPEYHVLVHTCDRVELYYEDDSLPLKRADLFLIVYHLFGVVSGIESPIVGECHVFAQVKKAYEEAVVNHTVSKTLHQLFQRAFHVGKKIRTLTKISEGAPSHSLAAFHIVRQRYTDFHHLRITILGVNHLNEEILRYFSKYGASQIFLGNRTYEKAVVLAQKYHAYAFSLDLLGQVLPYTDVLIVATSAPHVLVKKEDIPLEKDMLIIDLSSPRNVDRGVSELPRVVYYDLHETERIIAQAMSHRLGEKQKAMAMIEEEAQRFVDTLMESYGGEISSGRHRYWIDRES